MVRPVSRPDAVLRGSLYLAIVGSGVMMVPHSADPFGAPKWMVVMLAGSAIALISLAGSGSWTRRPAGQVTPAALILGALVAATLLSLAVAPSPWRAFFGLSSRASGAAVLLAGVGLFFVAAVRAVPRTTLRVMVVTSGLVAGYGLLQAVGLDPFTWGLTWGEGAITSTLGNPNFAAAYFGIAVPLSAGLALLRAEPPAWRLIGGGVATAAFVLAVATRSAQGPIAAGAGLAILLTAVLLQQRPRVRTIGLIGLGLALAGSALGVVVALAGHGPLLRLITPETFELRVTYWRTAWEIIRDHPWWGVGFDHFAGYSRMYRPFELATEFGSGLLIDHPHNVILNHLVSGGLLLGLSYLVFVGFVALRLVQGMKQLEGDQRVMLGAVGGAWLAYQVQSLVSIDVPSLTVAHWVTAGLIVGLGTAANASAKPADTARQRGALAPRWPMALLALGMVPAVIICSKPLRADLASARGQAAHAESRIAAANHQMDTATSILPWESNHWSEWGRQHFAVGSFERALVFYSEALEREPRSLAHAINAARAARSAEQPDVAADMYVRALELDPVSPEVRTEVAAFFRADGQLQVAREILEVGLTLTRDWGEWWLELARIHILEGEYELAQERLVKAAELGVDPARIEEMRAHVR